MYRGGITTQHVIVASSVATGPLTFAQQVMLDNPVAYYRMEDLSGDLADSSGGNHTVSISFATPDYQQAGYLAGKTGKSITGNSAVAIATGFTAPIVSPFTVEAIVRFDSLAGVQRFCANGQAGEGWGVGTNSVFWLLTTYSKLDYLFSFGPSLGVPVHAVFVFDTAADVSLYINGTFAEKQFGTDEPVTTTLPFTLYRNGAFAEFFVGGMDELAVYASALSPARIAAHYAATQ